MNIRFSLHQIRAFALVVGSLDACTGLGLVVVPERILVCMRLPDLDVMSAVYLRWLGVFVACVGFTYFWGLLRTRETLRVVFEVTVLFRIAVAAFCLLAITSGLLAFGWWTVPVADLAIAGIQILVLRGRRLS